MKKLIFLIASLIILISPMMSIAATLTPGSFSATLDVGGTATVSKTVTLDSSGPATSKVDVFFLCDNTGSMYSVINTCKTNASAILGAISGGDPRFAGIDTNFGVGWYRGDPVEGPYDSPWYKLQQSITPSAAAAQTAINGWYASGGADWPEANFYALKHVADDAATAWRSDAGKVIVWFGDAPSHTETTTQAQAIAALNARGVKVAAMNTMSAGAGIDTYGQASAVAAATGGTLTNNILSSGPGAAVDAILAAVASAVSKVNLELITDYVGTGLSIGFVPAKYTDVLPGESRTFTMSVTGLTPGTYDFKTYVKGTTITPELDHIVVRDGTTPRVPEPSTLLMFGSMIMGFAFAGKRKFIK